MSGGDITFNIAKGRQAHYGSLPATNDALILVVLKAAGLVSDAVLRDYDTLADVLTGASDECTATGYVRSTLANVLVTVDDTADTVNIDCDDAVLGVVGTGGSPETQAKVLICYDPDTTTGTDSTVVPISAHSYDKVFDGSSVTITMPTGGPFSSAESAMAFGRGRAGAGAEQWNRRYDRSSRHRYGAVDGARQGCVGNDDRIDPLRGRCDLDLLGGGHRGVCDRHIHPPGHRRRCGRLGVGARRKHQPRTSDAGLHCTCRQGGGRCTHRGATAVCGRVEDLPDGDGARGGRWLVSRHHSPSDHLWCEFGYLKRSTAGRPGGEQRQRRVDADQCAHGEPDQVPVAVVRAAPSGYVDHAEQLSGGYRVRRRGSEGVRFPNIPVVSTASRTSRPGPPYSPFAVNLPPGIRLAARQPKQSVGAAEG